MTIKATKTKVDPIQEALNRPRQIDTSVDASKRPLVGLDIIHFRGRHSLQNSEVINALCIQNSATYNEVVREGILEYSMELLLRLYDDYPSGAPWKTIKPSQAFDLMYGEILEKFRNTPYEKDAKLALVNRFTSAMGRSVFTGYRWMKYGGESKRGITKIFAKLSVLDNPRGVLEKFARMMFKVRGLDFDQLHPIPTLENPPQPKPRGPTPKNKVEPVASVIAPDAPVAPKVKRVKKSVDA